MLKFYTTALLTHGLRANRKIEEVRRLAEITFIILLEIQALYPMSYIQVQCQVSLNGTEQRKHIRILENDEYRHEAYFWKIIEHET